MGKELKNIRCEAKHCKFYKDDRCTLDSISIDDCNRCNKYVSIHTCCECGCELNSKNNNRCINLCDDCYYIFDKLEKEEMRRQGFL